MYPRFQRACKVVGSSRQLQAFTLHSEKELVPYEENRSCKCFACRVTRSYNTAHEGPCQNLRLMTKHREESGCARQCVFLGSQDLSSVPRDGGVDCFAAVSVTGEVFTWGDDSGGNSSSVRSELTSVATVVWASSACAALRRDGRVVTWGSEDSGDDSLFISICRMPVKLARLHHPMCNAAFPVPSEGSTPHLSSGFRKGASPPIIFP